MAISIRMTFDFLMTFRYECYSVPSDFDTNDIRYLAAFNTNESDVRGLVLCLPSTTFHMDLDPLCQPGI